MNSDQEMSYTALRSRSPFQLARYWGDSDQWPLGPGTVADVVRELAVMATLAAHLRESVHTGTLRAFQRGATVEQVADATGREVAAVRLDWTLWTNGHPLPVP